MTATAAHGAPTSALKLAPPATGAYHGAFMDFGPTASLVTSEKIQIYHQAAGKKAVWAYFANDWLDGKIIFPLESVRIIKSEGLIPYMRLMPWSQMAGSAVKADPHFNMQSFLDGQHDQQLKAFFSQAKTEGPLMMEFGPEVNGDWFPWNGKYNGGSTRSAYGDQTIPDGPERFRDAFRRVIQISRAVGAMNITWVFHVDSARSPESEWNDAHYYYPGDDYIDWIGISVFGAQLPTHDWNYFHSKLKRFEPHLEKLQTTKPWMISEFAVIEDANDSKRKALWIRQAFESIERGLFKKVKGVSYWNSPGWLSNGSANFKIDSSPESQLSFQNEVKKSFWQETPQFTQDTVVVTDK